MEAGKVVALVLGFAATVVLCLNYEYNTIDTKSNQSGNHRSVCKIPEKGRRSLSFSSLSGNEAMLEELVGPILSKAVEIYLHLQGGQ